MHRFARAPLATLVAAALTAVAASSGAAAARSPVTSTASAASAPGQGDAGDLDAVALVPALEEAFGARFGGWWLDGTAERRTMHVAVVDAGDDDRATVARLTGGHPGVDVVAVTHGLAALEAARDEIAGALDPADGPFTLGVDVAANAVVVETAGDPAATAARARAAAARAAPRPGNGEAPPDQAPDQPPPNLPAPDQAPGRPRPDQIPPDQAAPDDRGPSGSGAERSAAPDLASAVVVEGGLDLAIEPANASRNAFPYYEPGLSITLYDGPRVLRCTTGLYFRNGFGYFGSTAGHCGPVGAGVVIGPQLVDIVRVNSYFPRQQVLGDGLLTSMSVLGWPAWAVIHTQGAGHRPIIGKLSNSQIAAGLRLCFEGITSDGGNCGTVVRANQVLCCDPLGKSYVYSCTDHAGLPGDSGGPVYQPVGALEARAAGMLSSTVTIGGRALMCFSTVANLERALGSVAVTIFG